MRPTSLIVLLASLCCIAASTAYASADVGVVLVVGKAPAKDRTTVASAVRSAARSGGWGLVETPLAASEIETVVACLKDPQLWSCVSPVMTGKGIQRLIVVRVEPERSPDGVAALAVTEQVLLPGSNVTTADQRFCSKCIEENLTRIAFDLTKTLLEEAASGTARTKLTIRSTPPAAWITLDNTNVGLTDHTYATFPGRHVVILQREGYETETRTVEAIENQEAVIAVTLHGKTSTTPRTATKRPLLIPAIVAATGGVALVTGVGLQLAKGPPDSGRQPKYLVSVPGVVLMVGGGVAIGVGVGLYLWGHAASGVPPSSMPTAAATEGGAVIGWTGQF